jgi:hypothetical protein
MTVHGLFLIFPNNKLNVIMNHMAKKINAYAMGLHETH